MSTLRHGCLPSSIPLKAARVCVFGPLLLVAGCAPDKQANYVHGPGQQMGQQMAAAPRKVEIEDDGQPVQPPPARAVNPAEDDPTQPWSPHYGKGVVVPSSPPRVPSPRLPRQMDANVPAPIPATYRAAAETSTGSLTQLSVQDADAVIARAMSAHEMRKR
jgi:hypothetical protein